MRVGPSLLFLWGAPALFLILVRLLGADWIRLDPVMAATLYLSLQPPRRSTPLLVAGMGILVDLAGAAPVRGLFLGYLGFHYLARFLARRIGGDHAPGLLVLAASGFILVEITDFLLSAFGGFTGASGAGFLMAVARIVISSAFCAGLLLLMQKTRVDARLAHWLGLEERRVLG